MGLAPSVLTLQEIEHLFIAKYRMGPVQQIHVLPGGDNYCYKIVTPEHEVVLKEMSINAMNHPKMEPVVAETLNSAAIPTPRFYQTIDRSYVWELKNKLFHVQQFIPGRVYARHTAPDWLMWDSAELLGQIHEALSQLPPLEDGMGIGWYMSYQSEQTRKSYQHTNDLAEQMGQPLLAADARYRLTLVPWLDQFKFDFERLTRRNTHGDYHAGQLICGEMHIEVVIDLTTACVHPIIWELIRAFTFADPECREGSINLERFKEFINLYLKHGYLTPYDLQMMPYFYFYQLLRSNYIQQYLDADASGKSLALELAIWSTKMCHWFEEHGEFLSEELSRSF